MENNNMKNINKTSMSIIGGRDCIICRMNLNKQQRSFIRNYWECMKNAWPKLGSAYVVKNTLWIGINQLTQVYNLLTKVHKVLSLNIHYISSTQTKHAHSESKTDWNKMKFIFSSCCSSCTIRGLRMARQRTATTAHSVNLHSLRSMIH